MMLWPRSAGAVGSARRLRKTLNRGAEVKEFLWTQDAYDMITIMEAPDDTAMSALMLSALKLANVRGQTLRAFTSTEMETILTKIV
jgi:uncharacterized protein with GYD domain